MQPFIARNAMKNGAFTITRHTHTHTHTHTHRMEAVSKRMYKDMRKCNESETGNPERLRMQRSQ